MIGVSSEALAVQGRRGWRRPGRPSCPRGPPCRRRPGRGTGPVRASSSRVGVVVHLAARRITPQWPWLVYSHRQTSVITSRSGSRVLDGADGLLHDAVARRRPRLPGSSLPSGMPNRITAGIPSARSLAALLHQLVHRELELARAWRRWASRTSRSGHDEQRVDQVVDRQPGLPHHAPQGLACAAAAARVWETCMHHLLRRPLIAADLLVRQVAGRVRRPEVAGDRLGPDAEVAVADVQPAAAARSGPSRAASCP